MTDFDDLFGSLVDESAIRRAPVDLVENRAREHRARERRRHRVQGFVAGAVAIALIVGAVSLARDDGRESAPPAHSGSTTTTTVHVPAGWTTYDYGLARLSIPPGWNATTGCPAPNTLVMENPSANLPACRSDRGQAGTNVTIGPLPPNHGTPTDQSVNGIPYAMSAPFCPPQIECGPIVDVPALKVRIGLVGAKTSILDTLTYSTYHARVLQQPFGPTPPSWRTITYDGLSLRVPRSWKTVAASECGSEPNAVSLGAPTTSPNTITLCTVLKPTAPPVASLHIQTVEQNHETARLLSLNTLHHNGLLVARSPVTSPFVPTLRYLVAGGRDPLDLTIGLSTDPAVARGILGSLRVAP